MNLKITNFRGISSAVINLNKIALLVGVNEAGKTCTAQALIALLTGDAVPISGVKKNQAGMLVRSGTAAGTAELHGIKGITRIQWPTAKVSSEGIAPFASPFAVGSQTIVEGERNSVPDKDRVRVLEQIINMIYQWILLCH